MWTDRFGVRLTPLTGIDGSHIRRGVACLGPTERRSGRIFLSRSSTHGGQLEVMVANKCPSPKRLKLARWSLRPDWRALTSASDLPRHNVTVDYEQLAAARFFIRYSLADGSDER
jgi:hypothetical protein